MNNTCRPFSATAHSKWWACLAFVAAILVLEPFPAYAAKKPKPVILSSTGLGVIFHPKWPQEPKEIEVLVIEKGSPSDGIGLKVGDRIVGIGKETFTQHPARALIDAVDVGEGNNGQLPVLLGDGKTVVINLEKLGAYSPTAPYDCPKSEKIIARSAELLSKDEGLGGSVTRTGLLGLMATGEKQYLDIVAEKIQGAGWVKPDAKAIDDYLNGGGGGDLGSTGWTWGYNLIALGEYYLLTKDESVLAAMRTYALGLARGQDAIGLWGHRMARGELHRVPGYGIMNQPSLSNLMGMLFAKKCGIEDPVLDKAIDRTYAYVEDHVGKGGFPYGVHGPAGNQFNNNGTSGSAAICMALKGNQEGVAYFSRIAAPTHDQLTYGHASHFFNPLWTPLGASFAGPEVTQRFFKRSLWYFNSKRHWKGGFPEKDKAGFVAGQALLMYCLPRKALLITGREADESIWVKASEADELISMRKIDFKSKGTDEAYRLFNSPYSQVRLQASDHLSGFLRGNYQFNKKKKEDTVTPKLLDLIANGTELERITALSSFGNGPPIIVQPQVKIFGDIMTNREAPLTIRLAAASALSAGNFREDALPYYSDMLKMVLEERTAPDPFGHVDNQLSRAISGLRKIPKTPEARKKLVADKDLVHKVALKLLDHKRQDVRAVGIQLLKGIQLEEFHIVGEKLMYVLNDKDPTYHSYSSVLNVDGIGILADLNIKEGLDLLERGIFHGDGKWGFKYRALISALPKYGANAEPYIAKFEAHKDVNKKGDRFTPAWQKAVKTIREDKHPKKLITVEEAIQAGKGR